MTLPAHASTLMVNTSPAGARIAVDGKETPLRTPAQLVLPQGRHRVTLIKHGYVVQHRKVAIANGQVQRLHLTLPISLTNGKRPRVARATYRGQGTITAATSVPGAAIIINGRDTGLRTPATFPVKSGYYELRLVHTGAAVSRAVVVTRNKTSVVRVSLRPGRGAARARTARSTTTHETATVPDRSVSDADWPHYRDQCLKTRCRRARFVPICDARLKQCTGRCPGVVAGKVVNAGAYYSCADICKNNRRLCVDSSLSACVKRCNTR